MWRDERTVAIVRSDSLAALGALNKLSGGTDMINRVVREVALDWAEGSYVVDVFGHIPADLNDLSDALSRLAAPQENRKEFPELLLGVDQTVAPPRTRAWWRTLVGPGGGA